MDQLFQKYKQLSNIVNKHKNVKTTSLSIDDTEEGFVEIGTKYKLYFSSVEAGIRVIENSINLLNAVLK
ncbi:MAG: hypothetical protein AAF587_29520 [Bacteroidota bacterium]